MNMRRPVCSVEDNRVLITTCREATEEEIKRAIYFLEHPAAMIVAGLHHELRIGIVIAADVGSLERLQELHAVLKAEKEE